MLPVAPEEAAARIAEKLALAQRDRIAAGHAGDAAAPAPVVVSRSTGPILMPSDPLYFRQAQLILERLTGPLLLAGVLSLVWMVLRALGTVPALLSESAEVSLVAALWAALFILVGAVGFLSTERNGAE